MTAGGAVPHRELNTIDIVELIPEVVPAVQMLAKENRNVIDDPRTRMIVDDARHFLWNHSEAIRRHRIGLVCALGKRNRILVHSPAVHDRSNTTS